MHSVCVDTEGSYFCDCVAETEYIEEVINPSTGLFTCIDKDECSKDEWNVCHEQANCTNTDPNYSCECNAGYDSCSDINECANNPCSGYATCVNAPRVKRTAFTRP